jgi:hypothetical protein
MGVKHIAAGMQQFYRLLHLIAGSAWLARLFSASIPTCDSPVECMPLVNDMVHGPHSLNDRGVGVWTAAQHIHNPHNNNVELPTQLACNNHGRMAPAAAPSIFCGMCSVQAQHNKHVHGQNVHGPFTDRWHAQFSSQHCKEHAET